MSTQNELYYYDPANGSLENWSGVQELADAIPGIDGAERRHFWGDVTELKKRIGESVLVVELASEDGLLEEHFTGLSVSRAEQPDELAERTLAHYELHSSDVVRAIDERISTVIQDAWWLAFSNTESYPDNPFKQLPTEQLIVSKEDSVPVTIYNFSQPVTESQIQEIVFGFEEMAQFTQEKSTAFGRNIVIVDSIPKRQDPDGSFRDVDMETIPGSQLIVINGSRMHANFDHPGSGHIASRIKHELMHQIIDQIAGTAFEEHFTYTYDSAGNFVSSDAANGEFSKIFGSKYAYPHEMVRNSKPYYEWPYTDAEEDACVTAEHLGDGLRGQPLRDDILLYDLIAFIEWNNSHRDNGNNTISVAYDPAAETKRKPWVIVRRTGDQIAYPIHALMSQPLVVPSRNDSQQISA